MYNNSLPPGQFPPPPPAQPAPAPRRNLWRRYRQTRRRTQWGIGCGTILAAMLLCLCSAAALFPVKAAKPIAVASSAQQPTATATQKPTPAPKPTAKPTSKQTAKVVTPAPIKTSAASSAPTTAPTVQGDGTITLGQPLSAFEARYGKPGVLGGVMYDFNHHTLSITALSDNQMRVDGVLDANTGNGWDTEELATTACRAFLPDDAKYVRTVDLTNNGDFERVYMAPSLATWFTADQFSDENGNAAAPGTIAIVYMHDLTNLSRVENCSIQVGLQGK